MHCKACRDNAAMTHSRSCLKSFIRSPVLPKRIAKSPFWF